VSSPVLSPPQRHMQEPLAAYFIGDATAQHDPPRFIQSVRKAYRLYLDSPATARVPLLVNTPGWLTGLGAELLLEMCSALSPGVVIHLLRPTESDAAAAEAEEPTLDKALKVRDRKVFDLLSVAKGKMTTGLSAVQRRELQLVNYFDRSLNPSTGPYDAPANGKPVARGLQALFPYMVGFGDVGVGFMPSDVSPALALHALNGSIVALCFQEDQETEESQHGLRIVRGSAPVCPCLGLGIVRAVDPEAQLLFLLTPVPELQLRNVNLLLKGRVEMPAVLLGDDISMPVPYLTTDTLTRVQGGGTQQTRKNMLRKKHA